MPSIATFLKRFQSQLRLEAKFVLLAAVVLVAGSSIANRLVYSYERNIRLLTFEQKSRLLVESMAIPFTHTLLYAEIGLVEETGLLDSFIRDISKTQELDVQKAMLFDLSGRVIAHTDYREYGRVYDDDYTRRSLVGHQTIVQRSVHNGTNILDVSTPLQIGTKRWGTLRLLISMAQLEAELQDFAQRLIFLTVASVLFGIFLALAVARTLARPIKRLTAAMETVGTDFQTDLIVDRFDEIGQLQRSFLQMLTRLRRASQEQVQMQRMLVHTERLASIGTLASGVAHEINNPLSGLRSCIQRILRQPDKVAQTQQYGELMLQAIDRMGNIVRGMLDFARRGGGETQPVNIVTLLQEAIGLVDHQFKKRHIVLHTTYPENLSPVMGDSGRIGQVFLNLMMNAVDAMPDGGILSVVCHREEGWIITQVKDTGRGIAKDQLSRIFDPFYTTKEVGEGTGLGLSIAHGIVEEHGGRIVVESVENKGTTFTVYFPVTVSA